MLFDSEKRAARARRDREAVKRHQALVAAGESRILARSSDGRLISYRPEEFGFAKSSSRQVKTVWGAGALVVMFVAMTVGMSALFIRGHLRGDDVPWGVWFLPALTTALTVLCIHYTRVEWRARKIRIQRGLPRPLRPV